MTTSPIATFSLIALDCPDPRALALFYQSIIGGDVTDEESNDWAQLETAAGIDIAFQLDPNYVAPSWPEGPQQMHLDFDVADLDTAEAAVLACGARKAATQPSPNGWRVFLDPAGHPFCLVRAS